MSSARIRNVFLIAVAAFLIALLLSSFAVYVATDALTETRKSTLVTTLSQAQLKGLGAFHNFFGSQGGGPFWAERHYINEVTTAEALLILETLNASSGVDVDKAIDYVASKQYMKDTGAGGFGAYFESDGTFSGCNLYSTYRVVRCLKAFNSLDLINQTLLLDFIVKRYDVSTGSFHELIVEVDGKQYAHGGFPLVFRSFESDIAYAMPNIITTYAGICALGELGRLDLINGTETSEWILHSKGANHMFKPYPDAGYMPLPEWSPLKTNPFEVDRYGTGVPYTYAAISALKALGALESISAEDREEIRDYLADCQTSTGSINVHLDYDRPSTSHTYEAISILSDLNMTTEASTVVSRIEGYFQGIQSLTLDLSGLIPSRGSEEYGLHHSDMTPPGDSIYAIAVFNATRHLSLLDQPTPRVQITWLNLIVFSAVMAVPATIAVFIAFRIQERRRKKNS